MCSLYHAIWTSNPSTVGRLPILVDVSKGYVKYGAILGSLEDIVFDKWAVEGGVPIGLRILSGLLHTAEIQLK